MMKHLSEIVDKAKALGTKTRIAVAVAEDLNSIGALARATTEGFIFPILLGDEKRITALLISFNLPADSYQIVHLPDQDLATAKAVELVKSGEADVLMKGLVNTDKFLKAVLNKERGLLPAGKVMSYACALELPQYQKLLIISDTAVLTHPDLAQKQAMIEYSVAMAHKMGISQPKVALISATEKVNAGMPNTLDYALLCKMADRGQLKGCIIDGPLDVFLACDPASVEIKGVPTPIAGEADILIFPNLETANAFYKGLMLFAGGELAGLIQGTTKPVVVMSRSESEASKYYCIALSCLMAVDL